MSATLSPVFQIFRFLWNEQLDEFIAYPFKDLVYSQHAALLRVRRLNRQAEASGCSDDIYFTFEPLPYIPC